MMERNCFKQFRFFYIIFKSAQKICTANRFIQIITLKIGAVDY